MEDDRILNGNSAIQPALDGRGWVHSAIPRPLAEECISISLADLRHLYGRKELIRAAQEAGRVHVQVHGNAFTIYLMTTPHRIPNRHPGASDGEVVRLWIVCQYCRRKTRKLFSHVKFPGSSTLVMPSCRQCLGLTYQSQNCGGNRWWRETARPLKRLLRRRKQLLSKAQSLKIQAELDLLDLSIALLRQRAAPRSRTRSPDADSPPVGGSRTKRRYRDVSLLESL